MVVFDVLVAYPYTGYTVSILRNRYSLSLYYNRYHYYNRYRPMFMYLSLFCVQNSNSYTTLQTLKSP